MSVSYAAASNDNICLENGKILYDYAKSRGELIAMLLKFMAMTDWHFEIYLNCSPQN